MCMDEFVNKLYDFRGIYRIFLESKQSLNCQKTIKVE